MDADTFEHERLALFTRHGFDGRARQIFDGRRRTYLVARGDGPRPTVLIHGGLSHAGEWALVAGRLPGTVVVPDRPGCGLSDPIDYRRVDLRTSAVAWTAHLVDALEADRVDVVGHSMGGYFGLAFALAHPHRVHRLVLVGAPVGLSRDVPFALRLWGLPGIGRLVGRLPARDVRTARRRVWPQLVARPEAVPDEVIELDLAGGALPGVADSSYGLLRAGTTLRGVRPRHLLTDELERMRTPTLLLWGDAERFTPRRVGEQAAARMPRARFEPVRGAGHIVHLDRPDVVVDAITHFLDADSGDAPRGPDAPSRR